MHFASRVSALRRELNSLERFPSVPRGNISPSSFACHTPRGTRSCITWLPQAIAVREQGNWRRLCGPTALSSSCSASLLVSRQASNRGCLQPSPWRPKIASRVGGKSFVKCPAAGTRGLVHVAPSAGARKVNPALPNPSLKRTANGMPPGPGLGYAVHFPSPGPGVTPLAAA